MHWLTAAVGALLLMLLVLAFGVVNYSTSSSTYRCQDAIAETSERQAVYIVLNEYRPWVGLWNNSDGNLYFLWPARDVTTSFSLQKSADTFRAYSHPDLTGLKGQFSLGNKALRIETPNGNFDGVCEREAARQRLSEGRIGFSRVAMAQ
jgi:hypothetical protein